MGFIVSESKNPGFLDYEQYPSSGLTAEMAKCKVGGKRQKTFLQDEKDIVMQSDSSSKPSTTEKKRDQKAGTKNQ